MPKPFGGPQQVLAYLGRYTHRVALSNHRIVDLSNGEVTFRWKDYRSKGRQKARVMTLAAGEFMRRFLLHTLPPGFQRIRYFGFLANRFRKEKLELCRKLLTIVTVLLTALLLPQPASCEAPEARSFRFCPRCHTGILIRIAIRSPLSLAATSAGYLMTLSSAPWTGARSAFPAAPARSVFLPSREALRCHKPKHLSNFRASFSSPPLHQGYQQPPIPAAEALKSPSFPRFSPLRDIQNP